MYMNTKWKEDGWIILEDFFDPTTLINESNNVLNSNNTESFIYESNNTTIRSVFSPHLLNLNINNFVKTGPIVPVAKSLLTDDIYLHQCHLNYKKAFTGEEYAWHSDYTFWKYDDNMQSMDAISCMFLLDDMTHENGPLEVLSGSHNLLVEKKPTTTYQIKHDSSEANGMISEDMVSVTGLQRHTVTGKAGDVFVMHANLWHTSGPNTSSNDRRILIACYNSLSNKTSNHTRPEFITLRDFTPL
jgi:ectoine hydroxylase